MTETQYRQNIQSTFKTIENAFRYIDPDLAECEISQGVLVIVLKDEFQCILSTQPSIKQLWLVITSQAKAYHFNYTQEKASWIDDRDNKTELLELLDAYFKESIGIDLKSMI